MNPISNEAVRRLFTETRSFSAWLPKDVSDQTLHDIYDVKKGWLKARDDISE